MGRTTWTSKRIPNHGFRPPHSVRLTLDKLCSELYGAKIFLKAKSGQPAPKQSQIIWWNSVVKVFTDSSKILENETNVEKQKDF